MQVEVWDAQVGKSLKVFESKAQADAWVSSFVRVEGEVAVWEM